MRWLGSLVLVLSVAGCGNNNTAQDMSMNQDLTVSGDMTGGGDGGGGTSCNPAAQDCPSGQKCVIKNVGTSMAPMLATRCTSDGTNAVGATCTRGPGGAGDDDCAKGGQCTSISNATGVFACRKLCKLNSECGSGEQCAAIASDGASGYCLKNCTTFGTDCAGATNCSAAIGNTGNTMTSNNGFFVCRSVGTTALYADCMRDQDCVANAFCFPTSAMGLGCMPICDAAHASCNPQPPGTPDLGPDRDAGALGCIAFDNSGAGGAGFCE